jgi:hypothetical protein
MLGGVFLIAATDNNVTGAPASAASLSLAAFEV